MNKVQRKNSSILFIIFLSVAVLAYFAYGQYKQRTEEGLVYLSLFQPNPYIKEFEKLIIFSKPSICKAGKAQFKDFPQDVFTEFNRLNAEDVAPIKLSALEGKVPIVSWEDTKALHKKGIEDSFSPEGYRLMSLSRVGFNDSRDKAIVCIEVHDKSYQGYGRYYGYAEVFYLKKTQGEWEIVDSDGTWRS